MDAHLRDCHLAAGRRTRLFSVATTTLAARSTTGFPRARKRRSRRHRRLEGVERSPAFLVLIGRLVMNSVVPRRCLTRVMMDDDRGVEVAQLQSVMHRIQSSLRDVPQAQREYIANALLNLAVSRMVKEEGRSLTASILLRLGDVVASSDAPPAPERAVDLTHING